MIELANVLTAALTQDDLAGDDEVRPAALNAIKTHLLVSRDQTAGLLFCVCFLQGASRVSAADWKRLRMSGRGWL